MTPLHYDKGDQGAVAADRCGRLHGPFGVDGEVVRVLDVASDDHRPVGAEPSSADRVV